jgi:hypothetical protein
MFEQQIGPQKARVESLERNESALAKRAEQATALSTGIKKSVDRLVAQFPEVMIADPHDGKWVLKPLPRSSRARWSARRRAIVKIECPALAAATAAAGSEVESLRARATALTQREAAAQRSRPDGTLRTGWRAFFRILARSNARAASVELGVVVREITKLAETGRQLGKLDRQQQECELCEMELNVLKQRLDALEAGSID